MTYETGTASSLTDLLSKLDTFAQTTHGGWASIYSPNPDTTNRWFELKKNDLSFSLRYPDSVGDEDTVSIHQATGSTSSATAPGAHTEDSGNGFNTGVAGTSAQFLTERCVSEIGNGPFLSYHFFADDTSPNDYIHVVVEPVSGMVRHFGFGILTKFGDNWVGSEYVYGHFQDDNIAANAVNTAHNTLLDGAGDVVLRSATIRITSGLLNQGTAIWGVSVEESTISTDTAGLPRRQIHGGFRAGIEARGFGSPLGNSSSGVVPMYSIGAYYRDPDNLRVQLLGYLTDIRALNIRNFAAGEEITIGSDTWITFPMSIKSTATVSFTSSNSGIAYRKVT